MTGTEMGIVVRRKVDWTKQLISKASVLITIIRKNFFDDLPYLSESSWPLNSLSVLSHFTQNRCFVGSVLEVLR